MRLDHGEVMRILYAHPTGETGPRDCIAFVDVQLTDDLRLYNLRLIRHPDGRFTINAPHCGKRQSATFSRSLAERLTALAVEALEAAGDGR